MTDALTKPEWAQSRREKENAARVAQGLKPKRRIMPWIILAVIVAGVVGFVVLRPAEAPVTEMTETGPVVMQVRQSETTTIAPETLRETVKVTGTLVPARQSDVASQASGRVMAVMVRPGEAVSEGDVLAQIDRAPLELQLNQQRATANATRAQLNSSEQSLTRTEELARQGLASPSTLDQARSSTEALRANLAALESAVESAELALSNATVKSPLDGVVSSRSVDTGQTVSAGTPLFTIVNLDEMEFDATASVTSSARVAPGQQVAIDVTGLDGQSFEGTVTRVNPVSLSGTRTVPIYVELSNEGGQLRGGMFATGHITVEQAEEAIAVPAAALREDAEGPFVLKLVDGTLERQEIEVVREWERGRLIEVTGLNTGDVIVSAPLSELEAGNAYTLVEG
ncbi:MULTISPECIES: efflux RND transporter periplasmic adaptor subunit [Devosia]|uniref:efflux RND transporter periplasmic adaptor subunit n=1 Tax=Devosia TaxID=46913 RepID=UPI000CE947EF|nr:MULTISPECIES: efflux RND transporter periplasmic adaptor subunit [Devosia]AVF04759.1 efflux RND transporter periplasmic adaptor subunit [Devosia sp. I507]